MKLVNANKKSKHQNSFKQAELLVKLPADVRFIEARAKPLVGGWGKAALEPVYDAQAHMVSWRNVPLAPGRKRKYEVLAKVLPTATSPLVFGLPQRPRTVHAEQRRGACVGTWNVRMGRGKGIMH